MKKKERDSETKFTGKDNSVVTARGRGKWGEVEENVGKINGDKQS